MNPEQQDSNYTTVTEPTIHNPMAAMQPGEEIICEIKRHPVGMFGMYAVTGIILVALFAVAFIIAPNILGGSNRSQVRLAGALVFVVAAVISLAYLFVANKVYWGNSWIVTSDSITQIKQVSLFNKQTSQLSFGNLEDITAEQNGVLAQMFHFGVISAETAAATDKFTFLFCPNPTIYAQQILAARERFDQSHKTEG